MQVNNKTSETNGLVGGGQKGAPKRTADPAAEAGMAKVRYYQTDKWIIGTNGAEGTHLAPKNTLPAVLEKAFVRSSKANPVTENITYDRDKFILNEIPDFKDPTGENSNVTIVSKQTDNYVAEVQFQKDTFVVRLFNKPQSGVYPFSKDDLLKAVDAAKWQLEVFVLPQDHSDSE